MTDHTVAAVFVPAIASRPERYLQEHAGTCLHETPTGNGRWVCVLPEGHPPTTRKDGHG